MFTQLLCDLLHALEAKYPHVQEKYRFNLNADSICLEDRFSKEFVTIAHSNHKDNFLTTYYIDNAECQHLYQVEQNFAQLIDSI